MQDVGDVLNRLLVQFRALPVGELLVVVILSIVVSLLLYVVWRRRNHYKLVDLGLHQWLIK
jgi:hypothetical protein